MRKWSVASGQWSVVSWGKERETRLTPSFTPRHTAHGTEDYFHLAGTPPLLN